VLLLGLRETWVLPQAGCLQQLHACCCCCWHLEAWQAEIRWVALLPLQLLLPHHLALARCCCCCTRGPTLPG
jgi:hypothetical protein